MTDFSAIRRDMHHQRNLNAREPVFKHRWDTLINLHDIVPVDEEHALRIRRTMSLSIREIEAAKRNGARYEPLHRRLRPYRKSR
jgi:hypothetical protein